MIPAVALFIQYLPDLIKLANSAPRIYEFVVKSKENWQKHGEWPQEADDAFTAEVENYHPEI